MADKDHKPSPDPTPGQVGKVNAKVAQSNPKGLNPNYRTENRGKGMK